MTLEIPNELSAQIERAERLRGTDTTAFLLKAARAAIESTPEPKGSPPADALSVATQVAQKRREAAAAGLGMFAGHGPSVDEFLAMRHAEGQTDALASSDARNEGQPA